MCLCGLRHFVILHAPKTRPKINFLDLLVKVVMWSCGLRHFVIVQAPKEAINQLS